MEGIIQVKVGEQIGRAEVVVAGPPRFTVYGGVEISPDQRRHTLVETEGEIDFCWAYPNPDFRVLDTDLGEIGQAPFSPGAGSGRFEFYVESLTDDEESELVVSCVDPFGQFSQKTYRGRSVEPPANPDPLPEPDDE